MKELLKKLNYEPLKSEVYVNSQANNSRYIPIGIIYQKLDEIFQGDWDLSEFKSEVVGAQFVGSIVLRAGNIQRTGTGAVMIQGSKNSLVKDYPHLEAECIKSAAKKLGAAFGRNLNKDYVPDMELEPVDAELEAKIRNAATKSEVSLLMEGVESRELKKIANLVYKQLQA